ncbi:ATP-dependent rRNA helicase spb4 [Diatrype stigma]|uniref:ATP-dependent RNA helicase n=1 Tax=Diatrype stigma TaxID=117547 RepID=A0AAN9UUW9_9PEZI
MVGEGKAAAAKKDPRAWSALTPPLADFILEAVSAMGFTKPTPVQAHVIPLFNGNKDVVVEAVTGSGKTLAYAIPLLQRILRLEEPTKRNHIAAIIVSPTRELATQIHSVILSLLAFHPTSAELLPLLSGEEKRPATSTPAVVPQLLIGGSAATTAQDLSFFLRHSPNLVISTPGRLVELLSSPHVHCTQSTFEALVLDEADRLLDLGFKQDLSTILSRLPKQRRTGLFSASMSEGVEGIIRVGLRNPVKVAVKVKNLKTGGIIEERTIPASLQMTYLVTPASHKIPSLMQLLEKLDPRPQKSIVFLSTCAAVDYFSSVLPALLPEGFTLVPLHGKLDGKVREKNFTRFMNSIQPTVLLTTDVAARGLDFPQVDLVVQVDPPSDPKNFKHRAGRAGRAGRRGLSVVFLQPGREEDYVAFMDIRKTPIAALARPALDIGDADAEAAAQRIRAEVRRDRALHDRGQKAFVSWVRSYSKHVASSIFSTRDLDWADLGRAWGLLRLPKMPETRALQPVPDRSLGGAAADLDWDAYAYAQKDRERQRLEALRQAREADPRDAEEKAQESRAKRKRNTEAWSNKHEQEGTRAERRDKRLRRREAERRGTLTEEERQKEEELQRMLAEIREGNRRKFAKEQQQQRAEASAAGGEGDVFEGFD